MEILEGLEIPAAVGARIADWDRLSQWERSEVGRALRRLGLSYGEIRQSIDVKKSTLATWCRDITLTDHQNAAILARTGSRAGIAVDTQWRRRAEIVEIRTRARQEAGALMADPMWLGGVVLYWCEGAKTRNNFAVVNSDPLALRAFISWIRRYIEPNPSFALQLHLHQGNDDLAAQRWWRLTLDLPTAAFDKTFIKPAGTGHRKNHLKYGVCRVRMARPSDAWNRVMGWIDYLRPRLADMSTYADPGSLPSGR